MRLITKEVLFVIIFWMMKIISGQIVNHYNNFYKPVVYDEEIMLLKYKPCTDYMRMLLDTLIKIKQIINVMGLEEENSIYMIDFLARERCKMGYRRWGIEIELLPNGDLGEAWPGSINGVIEYKGQIFLVAYLELPWYRKNYEEFRKHFDIEEGRASMKIQRVRYDWVWTDYVKLRRHFLKKRWDGEYGRREVLEKLDSTKQKRQYEKLLYEVEVKKVKNYYLRIRKVEQWATYVKEICFDRKIYGFKPMLYDKRVDRYKSIIIEWFNDNNFRIDVCFVQDWCTEE